MCNAKAETPWVCQPPPQSHRQPLMRDDACLDAPHALLYHIRIQKGVSMDIFTAATSSGLVCNVTIPVFNRPAATQAAIEALGRTARDVPFCITVVDNGSEPDLVRSLQLWREEGRIDRLFLLPRNMGVACAANVGWELVDAPLYMKLDNDTAIIRRHWLRDLLALWRHGRQPSTLGGAFNREMLRKMPGGLVTLEGELGLCADNLPGQAILIPCAVAEQLGRWNEEYGLYGGEDGDYGLRMRCAGLPQYYYLGPDYFQNLREEADAADVYAARGIDKRRLHRELVLRDNLGMGRLLLNKLLYEAGLRSLKPLRRYAVDDVDAAGRVTLRERPEYKALQRDLHKAAAAVSARFRAHILSFGFNAEERAFMDVLLRRHGQGGTRNLPPTERGDA
ncbi:Glycosyl transferase family 2 [Desulfovibrio legallii]|uniref:Glycosyl transferase family 2 n=2 Tax=Desulfovibrio legallii TaxID=571438 RepID=A0A1G7JIW2_9BACT|nr:Glycosyl transferase family 2 [Desulfovibrio legallii]